MKRGVTISTAAECERAAALFDGWFAEPAAFPTAYTYGGVRYHGFGDGFACSLETGEDDVARTATLTAVQADWGLTFTVKGRCFKQYAVYEWTIYCRNDGSDNSLTLTDWDAVSRHFAAARPVLHHNIGDDPYFPELYKPLETRLAPGMTLSFTPMGGRATSFAFPYYDLQYAGNGCIAVVGWPGTWTADFVVDQKTVLFKARQSTLCSYLKPGEELRSPRVLFLEYDGRDRLRSANLWRRWMLDCCQRKVYGKDFAPKMAFSCSPTVSNTEARYQRGLDYIESLGVKPDICWIDAGWYRKNPQNEPISTAVNGWIDTGELVLDPAKYPNGMAPLGERCRREGMDFLLWFETDRILKGTGSFISGQTDWLLTADTSVYPGTDSTREGHWRSEGGWQDANFLADLTNPDYMKWLIESVDAIINEGDITIYRQDYNMEPSLFLAQNDEPGRQGALENHYQCGYLAYWDELIRRHPDMMIDACASGGRRNDLESLSRGIPFWKTDYFGSDYQGKPAMHQALFAWFPYFCSAVWEGSMPAPETIEYALKNTFVPMFHAFYQEDGEQMTAENLTAEHIPLIRLWEKTKEFYFGDYYPLFPWSRDDGHWSGWQFITDDGRGYCQCFRRNGAPETVSVSLHGLDADTVYCVTDEAGNTAEYSGAQLLGEGLPITLAASPASAVYFFEPVTC